MEVVDLQETVEQPQEHKFDQAEQLGLIHSDILSSSTQAKPTWKAHKFLYVFAD